MLTNDELSFSFPTGTWSKASTTEIDGTATQVFINDLKPLTNYDIRMFAVNNIGKSEPSKVITITTDEEGNIVYLIKTTPCINNQFVHLFSAPLTSPVSVRAEAISSTSILVKWKVYQFIINHETIFHTNGPNHHFRIFPNSLRSILNPLVQLQDTTSVTKSYTRRNRLYSKQLKIN